MPITSTSRRICTKFIMARCNPARPPAWLAVVVALKSLSVSTVQTPPQLEGTRVMHPSAARVSLLQRRGLLGDLIV